MLNSNRSSSVADTEERYLSDLTAIKNLNKETLDKLNGLKLSYDGDLPNYIEDEIYSSVKKSAIFQQLFSQIRKSYRNKNLGGIDLAAYHENSQELLDYENSLLRLMDDSSSEDSIFEMTTSSPIDRNKFDSQRYLKSFLKKFFDASKQYLTGRGSSTSHLNSNSTIFLMSTESFFNVTLPGERKVRLEAIPDITLKEVVINAMKSGVENADNILLIDLKEKRLIKPESPATLFIGMNLKVYLKNGNEIPSEKFHEMDNKTNLLPAICNICKETFHVGIKCKECLKMYHKKCNIKFPTLCEGSSIVKIKPFKGSLLDSINQNIVPRTRARTASKLSYNPPNTDYNEQSKIRTDRRYTNLFKGESGFNSVREPKDNASEFLKQKMDDPKSHTRKTIFGFGDGKYTGEKKKRDIPGETWEINVGEIKLINKIGSGSFGTVYKAEWHGSVAVKVLNLKDPSNEQIEAFKNEILIFRKTRHNNILLYMGCLYLPHLAIVTEWCDGSLYNSLHVKEERCTQKRLLEIAIESANGMSYLHDRNIIHRDLKSNNILLRNNVVKIGDFGLSVVKSKKSGLGAIQQPTGSILWMAPEVIKMTEKCPYTFKSDVYSFGIILYELMSLKLPYQNIGSRDQILYMVGRGYLRPDEGDIQPYIGLKLINMYRKCIEYNRDARPSFMDIGVQLQAYLSEIPSISRSTSTKIPSVGLRTFSKL